MRPIPQAPLAVALAALLSLAAACSDPEAEVKACPGLDGAVNPGFVTDREIQKIIEFYQLTVLRSKTKKGAALTCSDIPGIYRMGHPDLFILSTHKITRKQKSISPEVVSKVKIPAGEQVIVVVEGVAKDSKNQHHIVARGCAGGVQYKECGVSPLGVDGPLEIDLIATTGASCAADSDCESASGMRCHKGPLYKGGYCAKNGCTSDAMCPPGSVCLSHSQWVGFCARRCSSITDCKTTGIQLSVLDCVLRLGPTTGGMAKACLHWQDTAFKSGPDAG